MILKKYGRENIIYTVGSVYVKIKKIVEFVGITLYRLINMKKNIYI